jgi:hypothetical protein
VAGSGSPGETPWQTIGTFTLTQRCPQLSDGLPPHPAPQFRTAYDPEPTFRLPQLALAIWLLESAFGVLSRA